MAKKNKISYSVKKFIRREKSRIRRQILDDKKKEELINDLYEKIDNKVKK